MPGITLGIDPVRLQESHHRKKTAATTTAAAAAKAKAKAATTTTTTTIPFSPVSTEEGTLFDHTDTSSTPRNQLAVAGETKEDSLAFSWVRSFAIDSSIDRTSASSRVSFLAGMEPYDHPSQHQRQHGGGGTSRSSPPRPNHPQPQEQQQQQSYQQQAQAHHQPYQQQQLLQQQFDSQQLHQHTQAPFMLPSAQPWHSTIMRQPPQLDQSHHAQQEQKHNEARQKKSVTVAAPETGFDRRSGATSTGCIKISTSSVSSSSSRSWSGGSRTSSPGKHLRGGDGPATVAADAAASATAAAAAASAPVAPNTMTSEDLIKSVRYTDRSQDPLVEDTHNNLASQSHHQQHLAMGAAGSIENTTAAGASGTTSSAAAAAASTSAVHFPTQLHLMLSQAEAGEYNDVCSWQPHGRAFLVHDRDKFVSKVMPMYFRQTKFSSFQRQLNLYGYIRMAKKGQDYGAYYNELFLRSRPDLCQLMVRVKSLDSSQRVMREEPDFYKMKPLGEPGSGMLTAPIGGQKGIGSRRASTSDVPELGFPINVRRASTGELNPEHTKKARAAGQIKTTSEGYEEQGHMKLEQTQQFQLMLQQSAMQQQQPHDGQDSDTNLKSHATSAGAQGLPQHIFDPMASANLAAIFNHMFTPSQPQIQHQQQHQHQQQFSGGQVAASIQGDSSDRSVQSSLHTGTLTAHIQGSTFSQVYSPSGVALPHYSRHPNQGPDVTQQPDEASMGRISMSETSLFPKSGAPPNTNLAIPPPPMISQHPQQGRDQSSALSVGLKRSRSGSVQEGKAAGTPPRSSAFSRPDHAGSAESMEAKSSSSPEDDIRDMEHQDVERMAFFLDDVDLESSDDEGI